MAKTRTPDKGSEAKYRVAALIEELLEITPEQMFQINRLDDGRYTVGWDPKVWPHVAMRRGDSLEVTLEAAVNLARKKMKEGGDDED